LSEVLQTFSETTRHFRYGARSSFRRTMLDGSYWHKAVMRSTHRECPLLGAEQTRGMTGLD